MLPETPVVQLCSDLTPLYICAHICRLAHARGCRDVTGDNMQIKLSHLDEDAGIWDGNVGDNNLEAAPATTCVAATTDTSGSRSSQLNFIILCNRLNIRGNARRN